MSSEENKSRSLILDTSTDEHPAFANAHGDESYTDKAALLEQGTPQEETKQGCALEAVQQLDQGQLWTLSMQAIIRSIMDVKYDTMGLEGTEKLLRVVQLAAQNFSQARVLFDTEACIKSQTVGMALNMTLMVEALIKNVPLTVVDMLNVLDAATHETFDRSRLVSLFLCLAQICLSCRDTSDQIINFEKMMNPNSVAVENKLMAYFLCDVVARASSWAGVYFAMSYSSTGFVWLPFLVVYFNRVWLLALLFTTRGFVYPPEPPATEDGLPVWTKVMFACFPAGFVQFFTDFPFNGDLASKASFFVVHQVISLCECVGCAIIAQACDLHNLLKHGEVAYLLCATWILAVVSKAALFPTYYYARAPVDADDVDGGSTIHASQKLTQAARDHHNAQTFKAHNEALSRDAVIIYTMNECSACAEAMEFLQRSRPATLPLETFTRNVDQLEDREGIMKILADENPSPSAFLTMPVIYVRGEYVGSLKELKAQFQS